MANGSFADQVAAAIAKRKALMEAIYRESVQRTVEIAQTPGPTVANPSGGQGGHLPIDTGFLRASLVAFIGSGTPVTRENPDPEGRHAYDEGQVNLVIAKATLKDTVTCAYTASYAAHVHYRYQWVTLAAQQWRQTVDAVVADVKARAA